MAVASQQTIEKESPHIGVRAEWGLRSLIRSARIAAVLNVGYLCQQLAG